MNSERNFETIAKDYQKALKMNGKDWKVWEENIQFYLKNRKYDLAHSLSKKAYRTFKDNYNIGLAHAKSLLNIGQFEKVISVLKNIQVLPYEHASESRNIYERAHLGNALSLMKKKKYAEAIAVLNKGKEWPENIGVGKPYQPDERSLDYLLAIAYSKVENIEKSEKLMKNVVEYSKAHFQNNSLNNLYGLLAEKESTTLLDQIKAQVSGNRKSQLALALFENNTDKLEQLKLENLVPEDVWHLADWAIQNK